MGKGNRRWIRRSVTLGTLAMGVLMMLGVPAVAGGGGCYGGATEGSSDVVALAQACPTPTIVHVDQGDTVRFVNKDEIVHNVIGVGFAWGHPEDLAQGDSFTHTFDAPGVYPYACWYHPGMVGAVVVGGSSASATASGAGDAEPSSSPIAAEVSTDGSNSGTVLGWILGGVLGLALGVAIGVAVRRRGSGERPGV
jgi:plastocyanin